MIAIYWAIALLVWGLFMYSLLSVSADADEQMRHAMQEQAQRDGLHGGR